MDKARIALSGKEINFFGSNQNNDTKIFKKNLQQKYIILK